MTFDIFLLGLLIISTFTGLVTEAAKKILQEHGKSYSANTMAGYIAVVLSMAAGGAYLILTKTAVNAQIMVYLIALTFLSWLSAMIGYDKVIQTITQIRSKL